VIEELLNGPFEWNTLDAKVVDTARLIQAEVEADLLGWGPYFPRLVADQRLFLHARAAGLSGKEVAECPPQPECGSYLHDLSVSGSVGWGELLVDQTYWGPGYSVAGEHSCYGLFAHAPSTVTVQVPEGMSVLRGKVGLQDWNQVCGNGASFRVEQEGVVLWESSGLQNYDAAVALPELAIKPGALQLIASDLGEYSCDTAVWLDMAVACQF
jgi:hypothetical protein